MSGYVIPADTPNLRDYVKDYLEWRAGEFPDSQQRIVEICRNHLVPTFGGIELDDISVKQAKAFVSMRRKAGAANATIDKEVRTLKAILNQAVQDEELAQNKLADYNLAKGKDDKVPDRLTDDAIQALYEASPNHAAVWRLLINTGIRRAEALNLKLTNCLDDRIILESTSQNRTKSGKMRVIPLNDEAKAAAAELKEGNDSDYLLPRTYGQSLSRAFKTCVKRAGINPNASIHWTRHTFINKLVVDAGVPVRTVQELAGHANISTTMRYARHVPEQNLFDAIAAL